MRVENLQSQCGRCIHFKEDFSCDAFPAKEGIPLKISMGIERHDHPIDGDHGVRYELNPIHKGWEKRFPYNEMIAAGVCKVW